MSRDALITYGRRLPAATPPVEPEKLETES
jgi:hypothetical protein